MSVLDETIARAFDLARLQARFGRQVQGFLTELFREVGDEVITGLTGSLRKNVSVPQRVRYARKLFRQLNSLVSKGYSDMGGAVNDDLVLVAKAEGDWVNRAFPDEAFEPQTESGMADIPRYAHELVGGAMGPGIVEDDLRTLVEDAWVAGSPLEEWWGRQSAETQGKLRATIGHGVLRGQSPEEIARAIRGEPTGHRIAWETKSGKLRYSVEFKGGILNTQTKQAQAVARTAVATIAAISRRRAYMSSGVIKGLRQISSLDERTTKTCIAYDQEAWEFEAQDYMDAGLPVPERLKTRGQAQAAATPGPVTLEQLRERYGPWWGSRSEAQKEALSNYMTMSYEPINEILRTGELGSKPRVGYGAYSMTDEQREAATKLLLKEAETIKRALAKAPPLPEMIVHRGQSLWAFEDYGIEDFEGLAGLVGGTIEDRGFTSTTADLQWLKQSQFALENDVLLHIEIPEGARGALMFDTDAIRRRPEWAEDDWPNSQREILLSPGSLFRILGVYADDEGRWHMTLRLEAQNG